jgi:hypothetical protein
MAFLIMNYWWRFEEAHVAALEYQKTAFPFVPWIFSKSFRHSFLQPPNEADLGQLKLLFILK